MNLTTADNHYLTSYHNHMSYMK